MKRNILIFEAPLELTEQVKKIADETYTSTSSVCRQALAHYLTNRASSHYETTG
jgi:predicted transcriptional regulator